MLLSHVKGWTKAVASVQKRTEFEHAQGPFYREVRWSQCTTQLLSQFLPSVDTSGLYIENPLEPWKWKAPSLWIGCTLRPNLDPLRSCATVAGSADDQGKQMSEANHAGRSKGWHWQVLPVSTSINHSQRISIFTSIHHWHLLSTNISNDINRYQGRLTINNRHSPLLITCVTIIDHSFTLTRYQCEFINHIHRPQLPSVVVGCMTIINSSITMGSPPWPD